MSGAESFVSLRDITEVREMTRRPWIVDRRPMSASVMPSARYSCVGSPDRFFKGRTAKDWIRGDGLEAKRRWRTWPKVKAKTVAKMANRRPVAARRRVLRLDSECEAGIGDSAAPGISGARAVATELVPTDGVATTALVLSAFTGTIK